MQPRNLLCALLLLMTLSGCWTSNVALERAIYDEDYFSSLMDDNSVVIMPEELSLENAKSMALEKSPTVQAAIERIVSAQARITEARSAYFPQVSLQAGVVRTQNTPDWQTIGGNSRSTLTTNDLTADWLLFDGFAREARVRSAKFGRISASAASENVQRLLLQGVITAFANAQLADARIEIASADAHFNEILLDESRKKRKAGAASKSEVLNFEIRTNFALSELIGAKADKKLALSVLADLMGFPSHAFSGDINLEPLPKEILLTPTYDPEEEVLYALNHRPDMIVQAAAVKQAEAGVQAVMAEFYPSLSMQASVGHQNLDGMSVRERDRATSLGVFANWPIFTGGARIARLKSAKAQKREQEELLKELQLSIVSETEQAIISLEEAGEQAAISEENLRLTESTRELVRKEWKAGQASLTRLNEVQSDLVQAQGSFALALVKLMEASERLEIVTGRDLDTLK